MGRLIGGSDRFPGVPEEPKSHVKIDGERYELNGPLKLTYGLAPNLPFPAITVPTHFNCRCDVFFDKAIRRAILTHKDFNQGPTEEPA